MGNKYILRYSPFIILILVFFLENIPAFAKEIPESRINVIVGKVRTVDTSKKILVIRISRNKQYNAYDVDATVQVTEDSVIMKGGRAIDLGRLNGGDVLTIRYYNDDQGLAKLISATVKE